VVCRELQADGVDTRLLLREAQHSSPFTYIIVDRAGVVGWGGCHALQLQLIQALLRALFAGRRCTMPRARHHLCTQAARARASTRRAPPLTRLR
jgi:L-alanine-DL-glutamate epimerase-like enolase superfamily enzyme